MSTDTISFHISPAAFAPGTLSPDFMLCSTPNRFISLRDCRGRPVILALYPADWSPGRGDQMTLHNEILLQFQPFNAVLLGISVDGAWCHLAFAKDRKLQFPLLADFKPKGAVTRTSGVSRAHDGLYACALFMIEAADTIRWSSVLSVGVTPGADGMLTALEALPSYQEEKK